MPSGVGLGGGEEAGFVGRKPLSGLVEEVGFRRALETGRAGRPDACTAGEAAGMRAIWQPHQRSPAAMIASTMRAGVDASRLLAKAGGVSAEGGLILGMAIA